MKFLILNTDYLEFLHWLYSMNPRLEIQSYEEQMRVRNESLFGVADFYSSNLRKLGHEAYDIHVNNEFMQKAWAKEHGFKITDSKWQFRLRRGIVPWISRVEDNSWFYKVLEAQIRHYRPHILLNQAMDGISSKFLGGVKPYVRLLVGQIASPLPQHENLHLYDLIISSMPNFVDYFRKLGVPSELNRFGFEPSILEKIGEQDNRVVVSFVGSLSGMHKARIQLLDYLCSKLDLRVWGNGINGLQQNSSIRSKYKGTAWAIEMYQILSASRITLNHHIDIAGSYANNMRLFEATGVGTLLVTDWKQNLHEMFEPGKEVVAYKTREECEELIQYYLAHDDERACIAKAGQARTLYNHTYYQRVQELVEIVHRYF